MKVRLLTACLLYSLVACSQGTTEYVEEAQTSSLLVISNGSGCAYIDQPTYIINDDYVLYEDCKKRLRLNADLNSFRFPKYTTGDFALDKNGVYINGTFVATDTTGFKFIGQSKSIFWKTATRVFKDSTEVAGIDAATFTAVNCSNGIYFKDKDFIYHYDKKIEGSHGPTAVSESCDNIAYDRNNVYIDGEIAYFNGERLQPVNNILFKTSKVVVSRNLQKIHTTIDAASLKGLSRQYAIDKNHLYFGNTIVPVPRERLKNVKVWDHTNSAYASDGTIVYGGDTFFDAKTFGVLPYSDFIFDKTGVYERFYDSKTDTRGFKKFPFKYTIPVSEKNTTKGPGRYVVYLNQAYDPWDKELYTNLSQEQIAMVLNGKLRLTHSGDANTKRSDYDYKLYKAGNAIYWDGKKTDADGATFTNTGGFYRDTNNVYRYDRQKGLIKISGIDAVTVRPLHAFLRDKDYVYHYKTRIIKSDKAEVLGVFAGYRMGCGLDTTSPSNYYFLKNSEGYWLVAISNEVTKRYLGKTPAPEWGHQLYTIAQK